MLSRQPSLCAICQTVNIQALLLAAEAAPSRPNTNKIGNLVSVRPGVIHDAVPTFFPHQPNLASLKASSETCNLCSAIWKDYSRQWGISELEGVALTYGLSGEQIFIGTLDWDTGAQAVPIVVAGQYSSDQRRSRRLACFEVCADYDALSLVHQHLLARLQASTSDSDQCSKLAKTWLATCREHHAQCKTADSTDLRRPTRLLDVNSISKDTALDDAKVRLVQGADCEGPYAALSYCWGPDRDLTLTHHSKDRLSLGIDVSELPGTLRDAVIVARRLDMPYLWIDALCIFQDQDRQDSKADWAREAGHMRDVYRGAVLTIEAAAASRGNEGFLRPRSSSQPYCALRWGDKADERVYLRPMFDITDSQLIGTTIYTRGWTLQERLLAPRTLSFGLQQISFECANGFVDEAGRATQLPRATESYLSKGSMLQLRRDRGWVMGAWRSLQRTMGLPAVVTLFTIWRKYDIGWTNQGELQIPGGSWATYFDFWRGIVEKFSQRQLTKMSDRLPALSGLAAEFHRATGSEYVAGMWKDELVTSLAWTCGLVYNPIGAYGDASNSVPLGCYAKPGVWPKTILPAEYIAPSWSWASVKGRIAFAVDSYQDSWRRVRHIARVSHVETTPMYAADTMGSLASGTLTLDTLFLPIPDPTEPCPPDFHSASFLDRLRTDDIRMNNDLASEFYQHHKSHDGQTYGLLQLLTTRNTARPTSSQEMLYLLLVESCKTGGFRRLACVNVVISTLAQLEKEHFGHWKVASESDLEYQREMQPELQRMAEMSRQIVEAPWERREVILV